jgi:hypothetical protein
MHIVVSTTSKNTPLFYNAMVQRWTASFEDASLFPNFSSPEDSLNFRFILVENLVPSGVEIYDRENKIKIKLDFAHAVPLKRFQQQLQLQTSPKRENNPAMF